MYKGKYDEITASCVLVVQRELIYIIAQKYYVMPFNPQFFDKGSNEWYTKGNTSLK